VRKNKLKGFSSTLVPFLLSFGNRAAIWEKTFGPFMEERARRKRERAPDDQGEKFTQSGKLKKKYSRKANATASDAVLSSQGRVKGASKKINYDALKVFSCCFSNFSF
jgi:hypothetical protein